MLVVNAYKRVRKSFIENKIFKLNEQINAFSKKDLLPCKEADEIEKKKKELIEKYNKFDH